MAAFRTHTWRDVNFTPKVTSTGDMATADDIQAIKQSMIAILLTKKGERVMLPKFGSDIWDVLFEPMDDITDDKLKDTIADAISLWEPRVSVSEVNVIRSDNSNSYDVGISYVINGLTIAGTQSIQITLSRGN